MAKRRLRIIKSYSGEPMTQGQWEAVERIMARLIARVHFKDVQDRQCLQGTDRGHGTDDRRDGRNGNSPAAHDGEHPGDGR